MRFLISEMPLYAHTERKHGLSTEQFPVSAYVGSSKNLKDLKDPSCASLAVRYPSSGQEVKFDPKEVLDRS